MQEVPGSCGILASRQRRARDMGNSDLCANEDKSHEMPASRKASRIAVSGHCVFAALIACVLCGCFVRAGAVDTRGMALKPDPPLVGAYYFNWYNLDDQWSKVPTVRDPQLGQYDQSNPETLQQHHKWAKMAGIDFFAMVWQGAGSADVEDETGFEIDKRVQAHLAIKDGVKTALVYNIRDVVDAGTRGAIDLADSNFCQIFTDHLTYAAKTHFPSENYMRYGGSPVLFLYTLRDYRNYENCIKLALEEVRLKLGETPYIIGDSIWWYPTPDQYDWAGWRKINVSAVTAYNLYDGGQPSRMGASFAWNNAQLFHDVVGEAWSKRMMVVPSVVPSFDDTKLHGGDRPVIERDGGAELVQQWKQNLWLMKCQPRFMRAVGGGSMFSFGRREPKTKLFSPIVMVNSFNEWHEGTEIEPDSESGELFLKLLASLKAEVEHEDLPCAQEADATRRSPKLIYPKQFKSKKEKSRTKGDGAWIKGVRFVGWFFIMWVLFLAGGPALLKVTGGRPAKVKDDDLPMDIETPGTPLAPAGGKRRKKVAARSFTMLTWGVIAAVGFAVYWLLWLIFEIAVVSAFFDSRYQDYQQYKVERLRAARAAAHALCPELALNMHTDKFDDWVERLADNQVTQEEFKHKMCGDDPLHRREIQQMFLQFTGREAEEPDMEEYVKQLEEGEITLREIEREILASDEAADWATFVQANHVKIPKANYESIHSFKEMMEKVRSGGAKGTREEELGALSVLEERVEQLEKEGKAEEAVKAIDEYYAAKKKAASGKRTKREVAKNRGERDSMLGEARPKAGRGKGAPKGKAGAGPSNLKTSSADKAAAPAPPPAAAKPSPPANAKGATAGKPEGAGDSKPEPAAEKPAAPSDAANLKPEAAQAGADASAGAAK